MVASLSVIQQNQLVWDDLRRRLAAADAAAEHAQHEAEGTRNTLKQVLREEADEQDLLRSQLKQQQEEHQQQLQLQQASFQQQLQEQQDRHQQQHQQQHDQHQQQMAEAVAAATVAERRRLRREIVPGLLVLEETGRRVRQRLEADLQSTQDFVWEALQDPAAVRRRLGM